MCDQSDHITNGGFFGYSSSNGSFVAPIGGQTTITAETGLNLPKIDEGYERDSNRSGEVGEQTTSEKKKITFKEDTNNIAKPNKKPISINF